MRTSFPTFAAEDPDQASGAGSSAKKSSSRSPQKSSPNPANVSASSRSSRLQDSGSASKAPAVSKSLERKHEQLMKSLGESQVSFHNPAAPIVEEEKGTPAAESQADTSMKRKEPPSSTPQIDPAIGTFSQCYEPGQMTAGNMHKPPAEATEGVEVSFEDILTDPETKSFWRKYFRHDAAVNADLFANCTAEEYRRLLPSGVDAQNAALSLLKERVSLTGTDVSLNALQIFTKSKGLETALKELAEEATAEAESPDKPGNEEILTELQGVKQMLDERHRTLVKKEQALREKELILQQQQDSCIRRLQEFADVQFRRCDQAMNKAFRDKSKRVESLEQLLESRMAALKRKQSRAVNESASKLRQSASSATGGEETIEEKFKKQKARIASLEQIHKELKGKCDSLKDELSVEKAKSADLAKQAEKYKQLLKLQEMKQARQEEQSAAKLATPHPKEEEEKTEKSKPKPKARGAAEPASAPRTGPTPAQGAEYVGTERVSSRDATRTYAGLLNNVFRCLRKSLPYYISAYKEESAKVTIKIGELLYPSMGEIMPDLVDSVHIFAATAVGPEHMLPILEVAWETINFAFETQAMSQMAGTKAKRAHVKPIEYKSTAMALTKKTAEGTKVGDGEDAAQSFPIYPLFASQQVTRTFLRDVESVSAEGKKPAGAPKKKEIPMRFGHDQTRLEIVGCLLALVLADSPKRAKQAVERLRQIMGDREAERIGREICAYRGVSAIAAASTIESMCEGCVGLFLALTIGECKADFFRQLASTECLGCIVTAFENAVNSENSSQQDDLIVLLHKLVVTETTRLDRKAVERLEEVLKGAKEGAGEDRKFFLANMASLESYLKSGAAK